MEANNGALVEGAEAGDAFTGTVGKGANAGASSSKAGALGGADAEAGASTGVVGSDLGKSFKGTLMAPLGAAAWMLAGGDGVLAGDDLMVEGGESGFCF